MSFEHTPIPIYSACIRVLEVQAGPGNSPIMCRLITTPLQEAPPYVRMGLQ